MLSRLARIPMHPDYFKRISACLLIGVGTICPVASWSQDCIDYGDYLHWVSGVDTPGGGWGVGVGVAISGTHTYVADGDSGLQVIDITNPQSPQIMGSVDTPERALGVAVSGTHAYVADWKSGLQVIDITNPQSPQIVGSVDTPGNALDVAVSGSHAYAVGSSGLQVWSLCRP